MKIEGAQGKVTLHFQPSNVQNHPLQAHVALLGFDIQTQVKAGENQGKSLSHDFVVLDINESMMTIEDNEYVARLNMPSSIFKAPRQGLVAWVSSNSRQVPIQAAGGLLP